MTEQEKREKAIEEKYEKEVSQIAEVLDNAKTLCIATVGSLNKGFGDWYARFVRGAGYRREAEVRNETAMEIRDMLLERLYAQENILLRFELAAMITKIETVFGVEVEE